MLLALALLAVRCSNPLDACSPQESRTEFFSKGDCIFTRASFFQGHEWLTHFGNRDLPAEQRFDPDEIHHVAEGNRRIDWPKELLIHMNSSIPAYISAAQAYADDPQKQSQHFLLSDRNSTPEAADEAGALILDYTKRAAHQKSRDRETALTLIGKAAHVIQDSFSAAHTLREPENTASPWCIRKVKSFIKRANGFDTPDIEYHGGDGSDGVGHTTTQDSIYREGRDCHEPTNAGEVEKCLNETAQRARLATRDYLALVLRVFGSPLVEAELDVFIEQELAAFTVQHLDLCP